MTNFENKIIMRFENEFHFNNRKTLKENIRLFILESLALQREELVKEIKEKIEAYDPPIEFENESGSVMKRVILRYLDSLTSSVPEEKGQPCGCEADEKGISHTTDTHERVNGQFSAWCNFCNTITYHVTHFDDDGEPRLIKCLDCNLEDTEV